MLSKYEPSGFTSRHAAWVLSLGSLGAILLGIVYQLAMNSLPHIRIVNKLIIVGGVLAVILCSAGSVYAGGVRHRTKALLFGALSGLAAWLGSWGEIYAVDRQTPKPSFLEFVQNRYEKGVASRFNSSSDTGRVTRGIELGCFWTIEGLVAILCGVVGAHLAVGLPICPKCETESEQVMLRGTRFGVDRKLVRAIPRIVHVHDLFDAPPPGGTTTALQFVTCKCACGDLLTLRIKRGKIRRGTQDVKNWSELALRVIDRSDLEHLGKHLQPVARSADAPA